MKAVPILVTATLLCNATRVLLAQGCCTVGASSLGGLESGVQPYKTLSVATNYQYNSLTHAYQGTKRISDPLRREASVGLFTLQIEYGVQPRLSILGAMNFGERARELTVLNNNGGNLTTETVSFDGSGFGDMLLVGKYQLVKPGITSPLEIAIGGGASLPTGSFTKERNGSQLSLDLQPGTGAVALIGWVFAMRSFSELGLRVAGTANYRYAGTNLDGYRSGDEVLLHFGVEYQALEHVSGSLYLRSRFSQQDYASRRILGATGGTYFDIMPGIGYSDGPSFARVFGQVPLYRNVRGIQLTITYMVGVEYKYTFDFRGLMDVIVPEL